jgi:hypothetical protein
MEQGASVDRTITRPIEPFHALVLDALADPRISDQE